MNIELLISQAVEKIRAVSAPVRIVLFGSAARGEMHSSSDLDLLVVVSSDQHRRTTARRIYRNLVGLGFAVDVVVVTEEDIALYSNHPGMVIGTALREGRILYAA